MGKQPIFCVVGSGIMGLSSAYCLARRFPKCRLTMIYADCTPHTMSNQGFGICSLRNLNKFDSPNTYIWTKQTTSYCANLVQKSPRLANEMGIKAVTGYFANDKSKLHSADANAGTKLKETSSYFHELDEDELNKLDYDNGGLEHIFGNKGIKLKDLKVFKIGTWVIDCHSYLPWLKNELEKMKDRQQIANLRFVKKRIKNFSEVADEEYDLVVNCSGLGSEYLVPDFKIVPIRGQYVIIQSQKNIDVRYGGTTFICPKPGRITLGPGYQIGRRDTDIDPSETDEILRQSYALSPNLKGSEVIEEDVGIMPARYGGARVEVQTNSISKNVNIPTVHNYGHGGKGIMQHWGCALEVSNLAKTVLKENCNF